MADCRSVSRDRTRHNLSARLIYVDTDFNLVYLRTVQELHEGGAYKVQDCKIRTLSVVRFSAKSTLVEVRGRFSVCVTVRKCHIFSYS